MCTYPDDPGGLWSVVLAGGEGARMRAWINSSSSVSEPKRFCALKGQRSMFQLTLDRARQIAPDGNIVATTVRDFEETSTSQIGSRRVDLLVQPSSRGTAGAIYFALSYIMWRDPAARIVILPSDHFVAPEDAFIRSIQRAIALSALIPEKLVLIGAPPERMDSDYEYVLPGDTIATYGGNRLSSVKGFLEKPAVEELSGIHEAGGLWSTFIIIGTVESFFDAAATCIPDILDVFYHYRPNNDCYQEESARQFLFQSIEPTDFSQSVLQYVPHHLAMYQLNKVRWSDWGDRTACSKR